MIRFKRVILEMYLVKAEKWAALIHKEQHDCNPPISSSNGIEAMWSEAINGKINNK